MCRRTTIAWRRFCGRALREGTEGFSPSGLAGASIRRFPSGMTTKKTCNGAVLNACRLIESAELFQEEIECAALDNDRKHDHKVRCGEYPCAVLEVGDREGESDGQATAQASPTECEQRRFVSALQ